MEKYKKDNPYLFYVPNVKAEQFIKQLGNLEDGRRIHLFIGGNGSSKSCTLANIVANIIFPKKNQYFDFGIFKHWPFEKRLRIVSDPTTISEKTIPEFLKWFPKGQFKATKDKKSYFSKFYVPETGFTFDCMTYDQSAKEFESVDLGAVMTDEICPEDIWNACLSRLRVGEGGVQCGYFTPLASAGHLFDKYIDNPEQTLAHHTYITVWDNVEGDKTRGFLKRETIDRMIATYSEEEREARIEGKFMHLGGTIFKEFDRTRHLIDKTLPEIVQHIKKKDWRVAYAIDPHPVVNTAVLFMALLPDGRRVFIDEIWSASDCKIISKLINDKLDYFERLGANTMKRVGIIDPSAVIKDALRGDSSWIEDFKKNGVSLIKATKDRDRADDLIRQELRGTVEPNLFLLKGTTCRTSWEMARYQKDPKNPTKRLDKDDHMVENAGRLLIAYPVKLFNKTREEKRRKIIQGIG